MDTLYRCLNPQSIAVVGGLDASRAIRESRKMGFAGALWAVNPKRKQMEGVPCYDSVAALPGVPDATLVAVAAEATIEVVAQLAAVGAGGAVCYASGFGEVGNESRNQRLLAAAGSMPLMGPNCYGFINALSGAALWPDWHGLQRVESGVAIFSGSGNLAVNITMQQRSLPIALLATVGNQTMFGMEQLMAAVIDDERVTAIGLHIEGLRDLPLFVEVAQRAAAAGKPVVALKAGRSEVGAGIALSHTAAMAGSAEIYDALFERLGVGQVADLETFLEALKLLSVVGPLSRGRIASMSCSGGEAALIADLVQNTALEFPEITPDQRSELKLTLNDYVSISNPLDYHTFIWADRERLYKTFCAVLKGNYDLTLLLLDYPNFDAGDLDEWAITGQAFADACRDVGRPGAVVSSLPESLSESVRESLMSQSVVPLLGMQQAIAAMSACVGIGAIEQPLPIPQATVSAVPEAAQRSAQSEHVAKQTLAQYGLPVPENRLVSSVLAAEAAALEIGYPLALKASLPGVTHKTELGGVALNINDLQQLREQANRLLALGGDVLVERMAPAGIAELLLGVGYDLQMGHYLVVGCGGTLVELINDRQILLLPASSDQIRAALNRLHVGKLLRGYRGKPAGDIDAVVACALGLAALVEDQCDSLVEVDINPLIVGPAGSGATIVDALIVYRTETPGEHSNE